RILEPYQQSLKPTRQNRDIPTASRQCDDPLCAWPGIEGIVRPATTDNPRNTRPTGDLFSGSSPHPDIALRRCSWDRVQQPRATALEARRRDDACSERTCATRSRRLTLRYEPD